MDLKTAYKVLGLPRNADSQDTVSQFKTLAKKLHPDKNEDKAAAHENFIRLKEAFDTVVACQNGKRLAGERLTAQEATKLKKLQKAQRKKKAVAAKKENYEDYKKATRRRAKEETKTGVESESEEPEEDDTWRVNDCIMKTSKMKKKKKNSKSK